MKKTLHVSFVAALMVSALAAFPSANAFMPEDKRLPGLNLPPPPPSLLPSGDPQAGLGVVNGTSLNGIYTNGLYLNGIYTNGLFLNGLYLNGTGANGIMTNDTSGGVSNVAMPHVESVLLQNGRVVTLR